MRYTLRVTLALLGFVVAGRAELRPLPSHWAPVVKSDVVYKATPQGNLVMHLYFPWGWKQTDHRPAIVFFFGGGFVTGEASQFFTGAIYLATRGMVAASAEYRIKNIHHTEPQDALEDAKSAVRWLRANAKALGIDPKRLAAAGGSAGGTCAAFTAYNTSIRPKSEDLLVSSKPNALVLFNPAVGYPKDLVPEAPEQLKSLLPPDLPYSLDDINTLKAMPAIFSDWDAEKGDPPTIVFVGTRDIWGIGNYSLVKTLLARGVRAQLFTAKDQKHGFYRDLPNNPWNAVVMRQVDIFLRSLHWLSGPPALASSEATAVTLRRELP